MTTPYHTFMKAYTLISSEKQFCRGNFAVSIDSINATYTYPGVNTDTGECKAIKWDIQGAWIRCYDTQVSNELIKRAKKKLIERNNNVRATSHGKLYLNLAEFNDIAPFKDVIEFLTKLEDDYENQIA